MAAVCLFVAAALAAHLDASEFSLEWTHSVQKTRWIEHYRIEKDALRLVEASIEGSGAGMEPPASAIFHNGRWTWRPDRTLAELALRHSPFAPDYVLCTARGCRTLTSLVGPPEESGVVRLRPCQPQE